MSGAGSLSRGAGQVNKLGMLEILRLSHELNRGRGKLFRGEREPGNLHHKVDHLGALKVLRTTKARRGTRQGIRIAVYWHTVTFKKGERPQPEPPASREPTPKRYSGLAIELSWHFKNRARSFSVSSLKCRSCADATPKFAIGSSVAPLATAFW